MCGFLKYFWHVFLYPLKFCQVDSTMLLLMDFTPYEFTQLNRNLAEELKEFLESTVTWLRVEI